MVEFLKSLFSDETTTLSRESMDPNDVATTFLVVLPSFSSGCGRVVDLWGGFDQYDFSSTGAEADWRAIYSDWRITGQDLRDAMETCAAKVSE